MQQESSNRTSQASLSAALAAADAAARVEMSGMRFPGEEGGRSLGEMAQRDLDAALQLLTDRAQYITGSTGAAIALRRSGRNDMQCRASTGKNAPELGALLSTEFGLSGESVRTRRILRCDDAERDARVNQEVCRQLGIASVVVMPVVHDDEVLGVFELFSENTQAFGERDLTALRRLTEMVETAVTLARTAEGIPEPMATAKASAAEDDAEDILEIQDPVVEIEEIAMVASAAPDVLEVPKVQEASSVTEAVADLEVFATPKLAHAAAVRVTPQTTRMQAESAAALSSDVPQPDLWAVRPAPANLAPANAPPANVVPAKKPLLWSAAVNTRGDGAQLAKPDQSHIPPAFRNLRKCEACGFPVSEGRVLCVECEEKKWRGQLRMSRAVTMGAASGAAAAAAPAPDKRAPEARKPGVSASSTVAPAPAAEKLAAISRPVEPKERDLLAAPVLASTASILEPLTDAARPPIPTLVLSAGLEPSQSWLSRNKYMVGVLLVVAATVTAILLLR